MSFNEHLLIHFFKTVSSVDYAGAKPSTIVRLNGAILGNTWIRISVPAGGVLELIEDTRGESGGFRTYVAVKGGFPDIPQYLGSKSTSMGFGGYQVSAAISLIHLTHVIH